MFYSGVVREMPGLINVFIDSDCSGIVNLAIQF